MIMIETFPVTQTIAHSIEIKFELVCASLKKQKHDIITRYTFSILKIGNPDNSLMK